MESELGLEWSEKPEAIRQEIVAALAQIESIIQGPGQGSGPASAPGAAKTTK
jgi:hypothetical protein